MALALVMVAPLAGGAVSAAPPPTGLAPDQAKGTLTVNGKVVILTNAYATLAPNELDEKKTDVYILLTERPLSAAALAGELHLAIVGLKNYLSFMVSDDPEMAKKLGRERWIVSRRTLVHEVLKDKALRSAPDFDSTVDVVVMGPDRVEGMIYTSASAESEDGKKFEYRISFNARVKPPASAK
jgi:hypothetical protein